MNKQETALRAEHGWPRDPYKGLNYFSAADAPLFGQRETQIDEVTALLCSFDTRVVLLHGGTGTGKSSFLRAGLGPRLQHMPAEYARQFFFLREPQADGAGGDPLLIRATGDPVARIYETLRQAADEKANAFSDKVRDAVRTSLDGPIPRDRHKAIPAILSALKALTAPPQRDTFVLLVDQAEEVLTLLPTPGADEVRRAFFELIEQICFRSLDLRMIVALRTEYYGRFCSDFLIRPTNSLTPKTEVGAGLMDYLLRSLVHEEIAAAIRQPTLDDSKPRDDGLPPPRSVYHFLYQDDLPETIADDLLRQSGEGSTLPAMQIVCKQLYESVVVRGKRGKITHQDYADLGRAAGAIDSYLVRALRDAAVAANLKPLTEADLDTWAMVLQHVVGRAEGGTVQTLIASEQDLLGEAMKHGIPDDAARAMLSQMVDPERRLLRLVGGEGGSTAYSLGHDSLGPSVLRRSGEAAVRAEAATEQARELAVERAASAARLAKEREEQRIRDVRSRSRLAMARVAVATFALLAVAGFFASKILPLQQRVSTLTAYAQRDETSDFRLRLLLLVAALRITDGWPGSWFVSSEPSKKALREVLLRSPVFGGTYESAAWDQKGRRVVRLQNDKLVVHNLETRADGPPSGFPADSVTVSGTTSVGLMTTEDGKDAVVAFRSEAAKPMTAEEGKTLVEYSRILPRELEEQTAGLFIARALISDNQLRIVYFNFSGTAINRMSVFPVLGKMRSSGEGFTAEFRPEHQDGYKVDWEPISRRALRQPVLAEDCDLYAFLGRGDDKSPSKFTLWHGRLTETSARDRAFDGTLIIGAVAIARGCKTILVRDNDSNLYIVPLENGATTLEPTKIVLELKREIAEINPPNTGQTQPLFAAAPLSTTEKWRVAWITQNGLAVVDVSASERATLLGDQQFFTGVESGYGLGSLSLSPDGSFALVMKQQNFGALTQLRAFNLDRGKRKDYLEGLTAKGALSAEACKIASIQTGSNLLSEAELEIWLGTKQAPQPCDGFQQ